MKKKEPKAYWDPCFLCLDMQDTVNQLWNAKFAAGELGGPGWKQKAKMSGRVENQLVIGSANKKNKVSPMFKPKDSALHISFSSKMVSNGGKTA
jgi:hypothetical protein